MTPERWREVDLVLQEALGRGEPDRSAYLAQIATRDPALCLEVEGLLAEHRLTQSRTMPSQIAGADHPPGTSSGVVTGDSIGAYTIVARLGAGGMGEVFRARDPKLGRDVAIKILPRVFSLDPDSPALRESFNLGGRGITVLDAPAEVIAIALNYLGLDPNSEKAEDLKKAEDLLTSVKPYIRKFDSSGYIDDLANGDACLSIGYSGDVYIAKDRATQAGKGVKVAYVIPKEGTIQWFDMLAIPADAPHPQNALAFINYIMDPKVTGDISNTVFYANGNKAAFADTSKDITGDPNIYPPADVAAKLTPLKAHSDKFTRDLTRTWTRIKTGQ